jgi:hypothetical protein
MISVNYLAWEMPNPLLGQNTLAGVLVSFLPALPLFADRARHRSSPTKATGDIRTGLGDIREGKAGVQSP